MPSGEVNSSRFTASKKVRDLHCKEKDAALADVYRRLRVNKPKQFHALLMPGLFGAEAYALRKRGVPARNLFAVEDNSIKAGVNVHNEIRNCRLAARKELKGMQTTPTPMEASQALRYVTDKYPDGYWDLLYFDFMGQPRWSVHFLACLRQLFMMRAFKADATVRRIRLP
jgi:hypothetical protein